MSAMMGGGNMSAMMGGGMNMNAMRMMMMQQHLQQSQQQQKQQQQPFYNVGNMNNMGPTVGALNNMGLTDEELAVAHAATFYGAAQNNQSALNLQRALAVAMGNAAHTNRGFPQGVGGVDGMGSGAGEMKNLSGSNLEAGLGAMLLPAAERLLLPQPLHSPTASSPTARKSPTAPAARKPSSRRGALTPPTTLADNTKGRSVPRED